MENDLCLTIKNNPICTSIYEVQGSLKFPIKTLTTMLTIIKLKGNAEYLGRVLVSIVVEMEINLICFNTVPKIYYLFSI